MNHNTLKTFLIRVGVVFTFVLASFVIWSFSVWVVANDALYALYRLGKYYDLLLLPAELVAAAGCLPVLVTGLCLGYAVGALFVRKK